MKGLDFDNKMSQTDEKARLLHELQVHQIELVQQNDELRSTQEKLDASRLRYFDLYDLAPVGYLTVCAKGLIREVNLTAANMLGVVKNTLENQPLTTFIIPDNQDIYYRFRRLLFETGLPQRCELQLIKKDGQHLWVRLDSSLMRGPTGDALGRIVVSDISVSKIAEELTKAAKLQAEAANHSKSQFFANMSHELRTPMNAIMGMTDLVLMTELTEIQRINLNYVKAGSLRLLAVINDLLDLSKIEAGKMKFVMGEFSVRDVIQENAQISQLILANKPVIFECHIEDSLPEYVIGDTLRLQQILSNLINNAIKFTDSGKITLAVQKVKCSASSITLKFLITDTGIGISEKMIGQLFHSYSQAGNPVSQQYGGTGLGLTICKALTEQMGGEIGVQSVAERGSTFYFTATFSLPEVIF